MKMIDVIENHQKEKSEIDEHWEFIELGDI